MPSPPRSQGGVRTPKKKKKAGRALKKGNSPERQVEVREIATETFCRNMGDWLYGKKKGKCFISRVKKKRAMQGCKRHSCQQNAPPKGKANWVQTNGPRPVLYLKLPTKGGVQATQGRATVEKISTKRKRISPVGRKVADVSGKTGVCRVLGPQLAAVTGPS